MESDISIWANSDFSIWRLQIVSPPFREVTICASYRCHSIGSKIAAFLWVRGWNLLIERAAREAFKLRNAAALSRSDLADLEHVVVLTAPARCFGRAGHVELLLLFGNMGQDRTKSFVLDNRRLVDLRPFVESTVG